MADEPFPDDLRDFIFRYIDSVAQLEALLLLRANSHETWDVPRTAKRLYATESEAAMVLARLCRDGLLSCNDDVFQYAPDPAVAATVDRLAEAYTRHLIAITNMIHSKPRRIREFADAFNFRQDR